jgi:16S rRNA (cytidine1402-2'-O)-methyltransferase
MNPAAPERDALAAPGTLWLIPNALDLGTEAAGDALDTVLPRSAIERAAALTHWVVEDAKTARAFLKRVQALRPLAAPLQALNIRELPRPPKDGRAAPDAAAWRALLAPALAGHDMGLLSEAGLPAVADPGAALVAAAHEAGVPVAPLPGPSSITLALAASGLHGQSFAFVGYLPTETATRTARLRELEARSKRGHETQIAIETPYRNAALAAALIESLAPETRLALACGLTLPGGWCRTRTVRQWREAPPLFEDKHRPAVFLWLAG